MRPKPMANPAHQVVSCKRWRKMLGMASRGMPPSPNDWKTYDGPAWWLEAKGLELLHEPHMVCSEPVSYTHLTLPTNREV